MLIRLGRVTDKLDGLSLGMGIAALLTLPISLTLKGSALFNSHLLILGLGVAILSSIVPYIFELAALRKIPSAVFSILMSLAPAIASLSGLVFLGQRLEPIQIIGIIIASAAVVSMKSKKHA